MYDLFYMIYDGKPIHSKLHMMYCQISSPINLKFNTNCDKNSKVFKERFSAKTLFQNSVKIHGISLMPHLPHFCSGSIVMLCRNPALNPKSYFDKTFEEYKKGFHANGKV